MFTGLTQTSSIPLAGGVLRKKVPSLFENKLEKDVGKPVTAAPFFSPTGPKCEQSVNS